MPPSQIPAERLTEQQRLAVTTRDVSVVLSSGAGCGKTHVLTERYLSHLRDDGAEVGQIVAITFTDRAARQMRGRIRDAVRKHLHAAANDAEAEAWARHLRGLETAPVSTIHSFCGTILRQHAYEVGLDPRFEVLEEILAANVLNEALDQCLQDLLTANSDEAEDLRQLVLLYGWRPAVDAIASLLRSADRDPRAAWLETPPSRIARDWRRAACEEFLPRYVDYLCAAKSQIVQLLTLLRRHPPRPGPMADNVQRLCALLPRLAAAPDLAAAVEELAEAARVGAVGKKAWPEPEVYEPIKAAMERFRTGIRGLGLECFADPGDRLAEAAVVGQRFMRVTAAVSRVYLERKRSLGLVDFHDLLTLTRDFLRDRPDLRARLQNRIGFVLIDEFQDTDPVQMELVEYLCGGGATEGKLFAVGDSKQSIYRFRGAEVRLFQDLRRRVAHDGRQVLTINFRSQPAVLDFVNALFATRLADFEPLVANEPQVNVGTCVEFLWSPREDKASATEARTTEAKWIAARIAALTAPGAEPLVVDRDGDPTRLRAARPADVVLLFRSMTNVAIYESALRNCGLDYYLVGGRAFFAQQEIYDILNLLRALENPQDSLSLAGTLRSPFCCLSDEALFVVGRHPEGLWAGLNDASLDARLPIGQGPTVARARRFLKRWRALKDRLPIAGLLNAVFADSGFDAATQYESLGDRKLANLWKLLELARTFDRSGLFGLAEFVARLGDLVRAGPREEQAATQPENADVVRLMSIHQAKGLEFPIVFVADLAGGVGGPQRPAAVWDPELGCVARPPADEDGPPFPEFAWRLYEARCELEDWHEGLRTLYVACTRARDYLVLSAALREGHAAEAPWILTLAERFDLATGRCVGADGADERRSLVHVFDSLCPPPPAAAFGVATRPAIEIPEMPDWLKPPRATISGEEPVADDLESGHSTGSNTTVSAVEMLVRSVVQSWDYRDPDGWRNLLKSRAELFAGQAVEAAADALSGFAASDLRGRLATAGAVHHAMPFSYQAPAEETPGEILPVYGMIDCLWQDPDGHWNLAAYVWETAGLDSRIDGLVLAAAALRGQCGAPRDLLVFDMCAGRTVWRSAGRSLNRLLREALGRVTPHSSRPS